ncbi:hypothetical protein O1R50_22450 [Glycomyces luteolus]|uniref:HTH araC/xylS-type domain-containing protein n=1 Tax=Glycomyces luteolus TaxID=2670330 RepID=A0A9X3PET9_9ACTN|nr:DUF6597 domain-containing transcriptional factor [Glycomyces luteolus]MDA1362402.1 hypothetical protein [Glycomyces luteolus]
MWVRRAPDRGDDAAPGLIRDLDADEARTRLTGASTARAIPDSPGADAEPERTLATGAGIARVVPDGCTDLLWRRGALEIAGPDTAHREVPLEPGELIVGVRLRPGAARPLLGAVPATAVTNAQPGLRELWGEAALRLSDAVSGQREPWRIAATLAEALMARCDAHAPDRVALAVAEALDRPRPPAVASLAWELGYSERHLRRRVKASTGYGPKTLEQILRFRRTLEAASRMAPASTGIASSESVGAAAIGSASAVVSGGAPAGAVDPGDVLASVASRTGSSAPDWNRIAAEQGYADQAHLSRQVRRWSGVSPRALAAQTD